ncbi:MAG: DUF6282 family protein [Fervidicoccus fontis]
MPSGLLQGAYDLHVHSAPDIMPRKMDDLDMAQRIRNSGMKGYAIKSHYFCTGERAALIRRQFPDVQAIGAICLNNSVGGLNPLAVEVAARAGAKIVWMPTVDAANEQNRLKSTAQDKLPYWARMQKEMSSQGLATLPISITENGELKQSVYEVLKIIAKYNLVLATGHVSWEEARTLVKAAAEMNVKKIIVTHADFPSTFLTNEQQREMLDYGAFIEHCFTTPNTNKVAWSVVFDQIKFAGPAHCILSTDLGQPQALYPDEGLEKFASTLMANGFAEKDIEYMIKINPAVLVS